MPDDFNQMQGLIIAIAIFGSLIAFLQWRTNHTRLKHELFDRRFSQFVIIKEFLGSIMAAGRMGAEEEQKYLVETKGSKFIFDDKIAKLIDEDIWKGAIDLNFYNDEMARESDPVKHKELVEKRRIAFDKLKDIFMNLDSQFEKFLKLPIL
jgi:hypothetical protein